MCAPGAEGPGRTATDTLGFHCYPRAAGASAAFPGRLGNLPDSCLHTEEAKRSEPWVVERRAGNSSPAPLVGFQRTVETRGRSGHLSKARVTHFSEPSAELTA